MSVLKGTPVLDADPGLYVVADPSATEVLARVAADQGFRVFVLDGMQIHDERIGTSDAPTATPRRLGV